MLLKCNNLFTGPKIVWHKSCVGDFDVSEPRETIVENNMRALQIIKQLFKTCLFILLVRMTFYHDVCSLCANAVPFLPFSPGCIGAAVFLLCWRLLNVKMSVIERFVDINHSVTPKEISAVLNHCAGKESFLRLPLNDNEL